MQETIDKRRSTVANRGLTVNALKYISLGLLLLASGCTSNDMSKRNSGTPWYAPDWDSGDRNFYRDFFLGHD